MTGSDLEMRTYSSAVSDDDIRAIEVFLAKESEFLKKKDLDGISALYMEDAVLLPPYSDTIQGREAVKRFREHQFSVFDNIEQKAEALEVVGIGGVVAIRYTYVFSGQQKGQAAIESRGRGVALFKRTSEGMKLYWDIWNNPPS